MIDRALLARLRIEPLDRSKHDRAAFSCGQERIDNFLQKTAARQQDNDLTRVYVACLDDANAIVAYYALNAHSIDATTLPEQHRKKLPSYSTIAAIYLSLVGVHTDYQERGIGSFMMADAFKRVVEAANIVGSHFLVLDALNERAADLYRRLGFIGLPGTQRMLISMQVIRIAILTETS
jgi:ribosomal protein S18 acetylase RimI-like enzyme